MDIVWQIFFYFIFFAIYIPFGYMLGVELLYKEVIYNYFNIKTPEKNIRPKWYRNCIRLLVILIWPVIGLIIMLGGLLSLLFDFICLIYNYFSE